MWEWIRMIGTWQEWLYTILFWGAIGYVWWFAVNSTTEDEGWKEHAEWHYKQQEKLQ